MRTDRLLMTLAVSGALAFGVAACGDDDETPSGGETDFSFGPILAPLEPHWREYMAAWP